MQIRQRLIGPKPKVQLRSETHATTSREREMHIHHRLIVAVLVTFALGILAACERPSHDTTKENEEQAAATNLLLQMGWIPDAHQIGLDRKSVV